LWVHVSGEASYLDTQLSKDPSEEKEPATTTTTTTDVTHQQQRSRQWWFSWWVLTITAQIMDIYMSLNKYLNLIEINEYDSFYWYWDYICNAASHTMEKLRTNRFLLDTLIYQSIKNDKEKDSNVVSDPLKKKSNKLKSKHSKGAVINTTSLPTPPMMKPPTLREMMFRGDDDNDNHVSDDVDDIYDNGGDDNDNDVDDFYNYNDGNDDDDDDDYDMMIMTI